MKATTVTPAKTPAKGVALQHLQPGDLHGQLQESLVELSLLGRKASAEIRIRLLPMLDEVKRRYDRGETVNKVKGYHEYIKSLGLTPSTVRSWKTRDHQRILGDVLKSAKKSKELDQEEKKYERQLNEQLNEEIESGIWSAEQAEEEQEFERKLNSDPEFKKQHEEKQRAAEKEQEEFFERIRARAAYTKAAGPVTKYQPTEKDIEEFISLGRRAAAAKYHPDKGGSTERMAQLNQVADWLEKLAENNRLLL